MSTYNILFCGETRKYLYGCVSYLFCKPMHFSTIIWEMGMILATTKYILGLQTLEK